MALTKIDDRGLKTPIDLLDDEKIQLGTGNDLKIYHDATNSWIKNDTGNLKLSVAGGSNTVEINKGAVSEHLAKFIADGGVELYYNNSKKLETFDQGVKFVGSISGGDGDQVRLGASDDLKIQHTGGVNKIISHNGGMHIREISNSDIHIHAGSNDANSNNRFVARGAGQAEMYYDGSMKLETETTGAKVTGMLGVNVTPDTSASSTYVLQLKGAAQCYMSIGNDTTGTGYNNGIILGNDATDAYLYNRENTPISFGVNNTTKFVMKTGGQFQIVDGDLQLASGHGIDFSATSDFTGKTSELLDDYEEGTFSPTMYTGVTSPAYINQHGHYIKIGNKVHLDIYIVLDNVNADGNQYAIGGFPFNLKSANHIRGGGCSTYYDLDVNSSYGSNEKVVSLYGSGGSNNAALWQGKVTTRGTSGTSLNMKYFIGFFEYICA